VSALNPGERNRANLRPMRPNSRKCDRRRPPSVGRGPGPPQGPVPRLAVREIEGQYSVRCGFRFSHGESILLLSPTSEVSGLSTAPKKGTSGGRSRGGCFRVQLTGVAPRTPRWCGPCSPSGPFGGVQGMKVECPTPVHFVHFGITASWPLDLLSRGERAVMDLPSVG